MVDETRVRIREWKEGEQRDIHQEMVSLTLPIAVKTLFGAELEKSEHLGEMLELAQTNFERWIHYITMLPAWVPTPSVPGLTRAIKELDRIVYNLIAQKRAENEAANGIEEQEKGDLLSMLLRARDEESGQAMTDKHSQRSPDLFLAGHDTTALTLTWTLYLLAQNPDVETRLRAELESVMGNRLPTAADRPNLKYAEQVIQESMRLYPPAWVVGRSVIEPCTVGGQALSVGNTVIMSQWVMHRAPRWFADPETFRPERWQNDFAKTLPRYAYFPFGGGPRVCIGNTFALMESVLVLATILQTWRLELVPDQNIALQTAVTLRPKHGIQMRVQKTR